MQKIKFSQIPQVPDGDYFIVSRVRWDEISLLAQVHIVPDDELSRELEVEEDEIGHFVYLSREVEGPAADCYRIEDFMKAARGHESEEEPVVFYLSASELDSAEDE